MISGRWILGWFICAIIALSGTITGHPILSAETVASIVTVPSEGVARETGKVVIYRGTQEEIDECQQRQLGTREQPYGMADTATDTRQRDLKSLLTETDIQSKLSMQALLQNLQRDLSVQVNWTATIGCAIAMLLRLQSSRFRLLRIQTRGILHKYIS